MRILGDAPILFVIAFFPILIVLRIIVFIVVKIVEAHEPKARTANTCEVESQSNSSPELEQTEPTDEAEPELQEESVAVATIESSEATEADEAPAEDTEAEGNADPEATEENAVNEEKTHTPPVENAENHEKVEPVSCAAESSDDERVVYKAACKEPAPKKKKKFKGIYDECGWRRLVSIATGILGGVLVLAVMLLPFTYLMSIFTTATDAIHNSDAVDSPVYELIDVVDDYVISPYEKSFVSSFYGTTGINDLINFTARAGGKIVLEDGEVVYADDVLKGVLYNAVSAAAQLTSEVSECKDVRNNVNSIVGDPMLSTILADVVMEYIAEVDLEEIGVDSDDAMAGFVAGLVEYYQNADKAIIRQDLSALADAAGVLAEKKIVAQLINQDVDFESMIKDGETLASLVEAISGLSSFGPTIQSAFELGINMLGEGLMIPEDDAAVYDIFVADILEKMVKTSGSSYDIARVQYYVYHTANNGLKANSSNGIAGYSDFSAYVAQWERVQSAFAHASEDKSYGYFTIEINGDLYVYDSSSKTIEKYTEQNKEQYKNKISHVSGLINALTLYSSTKQLTVENLYTILTDYANKSTDEASVALANKILNKDSYVAEAVTVEKLLASTDFEDWTTEEKATDSRLCVEIITDLIDVMAAMESFEMDGEANEMEMALMYVDMFTMIGSVMDVMQQTSCIKDLPPLLIEGLIKNEMIADFLKPSLVFQMNEIVANNEDKTYYDCMNQIAGNIRFAIQALGGSII